MFISICVIAYNEEETINGILGDIAAQDYPHKDMEVILVDGASTDRTKELMEQFAKEHVGEFRRVALLDNPKRTLPSGWNVALRAYEGEAVLKVDAHAKIPEDFVSKNVAELEKGEYIVGGRRPNIIVNDTPFNQTLLLAESSMFGSSIAPYRNNPGKKYVNSLFHAAYRREVFDKVGFFNEDLVRTEDNEIHYRMRKAGFKLAFCPEIESWQHTRGSLIKMLKQKYANGFWIGLTTGVCPKCLSIYHFVPFAFVAAIILSAAGLTVFGGLKKCASAAGMACAKVFGALKTLVSALTKLMWSLYAVLALVMSAVSVIKAGKKRNVTCAALPFLFLLLHLSYGIGTLVGLIKMPRWVKGIRERNGRDKER